MNKIMEYMFFGLPIVSYDLTEHRVSAQDAAIYAESNSEAALAEEVAKLLDDPETRKQMSEYGSHRVREKLVWQHSVPPLLTAYDAIFGRFKTPRGSQDGLQVAKDGHGG